MKVFVLLALLFVSSFAALTNQQYQNAFIEFMHKYSKSYAHDEFQARFVTFKENLDFINDLNAQNRGFKVAMNKFGDLSNQEFVALYTGLRIPANYVHTVTPSTRRNVTLPDSFDWRTKGAVTPVKNQGQCGSCWSFSTTGSVEGCHFFGTNQLVSLSEQNLVDCSSSQGNQGCNGGLMTSAMDYIIQNKGIDTESSYPYTATDGSCSYNPSNSGSTLTSYTNVQSGSEGDLQDKTSQGPVSIAIDASHSSFQFYSSGVYNEPDCSSSALDHGVLSIGWGTDAGSDYWLVKNSWGTDWGQAGYIWMSRNKNNQCGVATMATLPNGCN
jgi:cathepsin L